jgi:hypothetical protein
MERTDRSLIWRWEPVRPCMWAATLGAIVVIGVVPAHLDGRGLFPDALLYAAVWGIPVWGVLLVLWSAGRYERIVVMPDELRIGRDVLPIADIDVGASQAELQKLQGLTRADRDRASAEWPGRPVGGAWQQRMGTRSLLLRGRRGQRWRVVCSDSDGLLEAIATAQCGAAAPVDP